MKSASGKVLAIIAGSGLTSLPDLKITQVDENISTPYGEPSGPLTHGILYQREILFLVRHGVGHTIPPHRVNYRANLWALKVAGANRILAVNAVGGIHADLGPGRIVIPEQIIDYTFDREHTYCDGNPGMMPTPDEQNNEEIHVTHVDFTYPYCMTLRARLLAASAAAGIDIYFGGTYGATQGPRLESKAEIDRMERDGCHMVGMTGMPEAGLAKELGLCYACCAVVSNWAAGRADTDISTVQMERVLRTAMDKVRVLIEPLMLGL
ncbi:S-methyl-5'-thioinosine phosphorylase [Gammaproteobacteria bacterium]